MQLISALQGFSFTLPELHSEITKTGWEVKKVKYDKKTDRYIASAKASHGEQVEAVGKNEQQAVANLLHTITHRNHMRSSKLSMWTFMFTDKLGPIAEAYAKAPVYELKAAAAFQALGQDCVHRAKALQDHLQITVTNNPDPYTSPEKMHDDVRKRRKLEVSKANLEHPIWSEEQALAYRICHEVLGYVAANSGWDWQGENEAFAAHAAIVPEEAQKALFAESIGQTAYATYFQAYGPTKICLFPAFLDEAQDKMNPAKGHRGLHPSQMVPPVAEPSVKPEVTASTKEWIFNNSVPYMAAANPALTDPNEGFSTGVQPLQNNAYLNHGDPLEYQNVMDNGSLIDTEWARMNQEDPQQLAEMKKAIVNAFRVVLLSPRKDLKWNAIHYQDIASIPGDQKDPTQYWHKLEQSRQSWNVERFGEEARFDHMPYAKQWRQLEQLTYQKNPQAGWETAKKEAGDFLFRQLTRIQDKVMKEDADSPEEKQRDMYQIENQSNKEVGLFLKQYIAEHQLSMDFTSAKEMQNPEQMGFDMDVPQIQKPKLGKYGAFMGTHLQAIAKVSQHVDEVLEAALYDVHNKDGSGHHFRSAVLQLGISGVGPKVCSFAWLLLQPMTSQLATIDTHMMDVLGHNFEKDMNNRDYFKFERELQAGRDASGYGHMPLGMFQWGCFVPGTLVRTRQGFKAIETIRQGDEVLTAQGNWKPVRKTMSKRHDGELVQLTTNGSAHSILTTDEHPFLTLKGNHKPGRQTPCQPAACADHGRDPTPHHHLDWTLAKDLRVGDWFPLTVDQDVRDCQSLIAPSQKRAFGPREFKLTPEFLWICGFYIAEGSCEPNRVNFAMNGQETDFQNRLIKFAESHGYGYDVRREDGPNGGKCNIRINSGILAKWLPEKFGTGCHNKKISGELLSLPVDKLVHLVQGVYDGDGKKTTNAIEQTSSILALQLVEAASRLGAQPTTARYLEATSTYKSDVYRVHEPIEAKRSARAKPDVWKMGDWDLRKITAIERIEYHGPVFNLSIEDDESYVVENIPVHNCWDHKRTGPGTHQDHSAMKVLNPVPHSSMDWEEKMQNFKGADWHNRAPEWWQQTAPAREAVAKQWDEQVAPNVPQNQFPFNNGSMPEVMAKVRTSASSLVPWFLHPTTGARIQGAPGTTLMQHARSVLGGEPEDIWGQLADESVGKV
jgi:hypothetical protein